MQWFYFFFLFEHADKQSTVQPRLLFTSLHWPCKVVPSSWHKPVQRTVALLPLCVLTGPATSPQTEPPAITALSPFPAVFFFSAAVSTRRAGTDREHIFSRMLVSHGGLDVFYPVSSTIWNQCSWRGMAAVEQQRNHKGNFHWGSFINANHVSTRFFSAVPTHLFNHLEIASSNPEWSCILPRPGA